MASRNDPRPRRNFGGISTTAPHIITERMELRLLGELSLMSEDATATRESFDLDTPAAHRSHRNPCPLHKSHAFPDTYIKACERFIPLRCSDAELDPARNHVEELMMSILSGECDNPMEESRTPTWPDDESARDWINQPKHAGKYTDGSPLWELFDPRTMELASYMDGQPQFRDRKSKKLIDPRKLSRPNRHGKRSMSNRPKAAASRAPAASPQRVAQVVSLAHQTTVPSAPIAWENVLLDDIIPK